MTVCLDFKCFGEFRSVIHTLTGISIAADRVSLIEGRLRRRLRTLQLNSYQDYLHLVRRDVNEQKTFIELITTNETYCFRTPRVWNYLQETVLPKWHGQNAGCTFRAWSAAASSGEEAVSMGVLCQAFKSINPGFKFEILGTDISRSMIERCREGKYSGRSLRMFRETRPTWFADHMQKVGPDEFRASNEIRSRLCFHEHNLFQALKTEECFDLVLLRNVLIYFTTEDQEKVLTQIPPRIAPNGLLIIGESESLAHIDSGFRKKATYVYEKEPCRTASG